MFLTVAIISITWAIFRGGSLRRLAELHFRGAWAAFAALVLQVGLERAGWWGLEAVRPWAPWLHLGSYLLLFWAIRDNRHLPGMGWLALGTALNFLVVAANGGSMPIDPKPVEALGIPAGTPLRRLSMTHRYIDEATRLPWLGDRFLVPGPPFVRGLASAGDFALLLGLFVLIQGAMAPGHRGPRRV